MTPSPPGSRVTLAAGPVSWGVDFAADPDNPPYAEVLEGISASGLRSIELGPVGYLPAGRAVLARHGLASVGTFVFDDLTGGGAIREAERAIDAIVASGGRFLIVIDRPDDDRAATAGRADAARRLDAVGHRRLVAVVRAIAARAGERGVRAVFHPHAGSHVEFEDEIEDLLAAVPAAELGLCLDTGHALYAGADPLLLVARHAGRIEHLHLKDVDGRRLRAARRERQTFWTAIAGGVFCPVGDGLLALDRLRDALAAADYRGVATIEQDRRPESPGAPADDLRRSVMRLRAAGIGSQ